MGAFAAAQVPCKSSTFDLIVGHLTMHREDSRAANHTERRKPLRIRSDTILRTQCPTRRFWSLSLNDYVINLFLNTFYAEVRPALLSLGDFARGFNKVEGDLFLKHFRGADSCRSPTAPRQRQSFAARGTSRGGAAPSLAVIASSIPSSSRKTSFYFTLLGRRGSDHGTKEAGSVIGMSSWTCHQTPLDTLDILLLLLAVYMARSPAQHTPSFTVIPFSSRSAL